MFMLNFILNGETLLDDKETDDDIYMQKKCYHVLKICVAIFVCNAITKTWSQG